MFGIPGTRRLLKRGEQILRIDTSLKIERRERLSFITLLSEESQSALKNNIAFYQGSSAELGTCRYATSPGTYISYLVSLSLAKDHRVGGDSLSIKLVSPAN